MSEPNVVGEVVAKSLCCGCGVCAGVCPDGAVEMRFNTRGELVPALAGACSECELCLRVCPALEAGKPLSPEALFRMTPHTRQAAHFGQYIACHVGHSPRHRDRGASGGMATWTLQQLFFQSKIDAAVCVGRSEKKDRLFDAVIVPTQSLLLSCSSSKYYPVEFSSALSHILENEGRYAVIALPCVVTAIRKAQRAVPVLRERIRYILGLVCGHGVSKHFTNFLLAVTGLEETSVKNVDFRHAGRSRDATNFAFRAQRTTGEWSRPLFFDGLYGRLWTGRFFVPRACDFCDDLFAPLSDATFMDAWLPDYTHDARGTSIVVVRHSEVAELLRKGSQTGACDLRPIEIERVRQSQSGPLAYKTVYLPLRVARAERDGQRIPRSFPRAPLPGGLRERLAKIKHTARDRVCRWTFGHDRRPRRFWVSVLTAYLRGQRAWWAARRCMRGFRNRAPRLRLHTNSTKRMTTSRDKQKPHFLLMGHGGIYNRGCEAILDSTFRLLDEQFGNPTFTVVSFDWANDRRYEKTWRNVRFRNVTPERWRSPHWYLRVARRLLRLPAGDWRSMHRHLRREYRKADAVLSVGGDNYTTDYSPFPGYYLDVLKYAREQGTKDVIWGATVGPFDDTNVRNKVSEVLKDTSLITARDPLTVEYLASLRITQNVRAVADPAFLLEPLPSSTAQSYRIGEKGKWLGLSVSPMIWRYVTNEGDSDRSEVLVRFIDWAIEACGTSVALIPHVVDTRPTASPNNNDHRFLHQISERIARKERAVLADPSLRAREIKHLISHCNFFIGSRTHSTISALSSGVPTISLSYSMKSRGINRQVLGNEDFILPVNDLSLEKLQEMFQQLLRREEEIRATLKERIPVVKKMSRRNAKYLAELLGDETSEKEDDAGAR